ncbi:uncharacterized protein [Rutidosis leptorrhynchoides]|uniref:uncharacterized protein isoform X2 n=1 Tax=Rutidosis leptorrhynchoides TaxID=125765 RepID=UPI003A99AC4D
MATHETFTLLNQLKKGNQECKVMVKVHYVWKKFFKSNPTKPSSLEMVLLDHEGNKIRAGMEKEVIHYFEKTFTEGRFLILSNFKVIDSTDDYVKFINNPYKIMINKNQTKVHKCADFVSVTHPFMLLSAQS